jgi:hypothetical protein
MKITSYLRPRTANRSASIWSSAIEGEGNDRQPQNRASRPSTAQPSTDAFPAIVPRDPRGAPATLDFRGGEPDGVSRQSLHAVLRGEAAVTVEMALNFAPLCGGAAEVYLQMQARRDLWLAEQRLRDRLAAIEPAKS